MKDLKIFINLTRLNRPIGYLLLFWPCSWGLAYAFSLNNDIELLLSCSIVAVMVVLLTQLISDIGYVFLNPRIRVN